MSGGMLSGRPVVKGKLHLLSHPQFPHLYNGTLKVYLKGLLREFNDASI